MPQESELQQQRRANLEALRTLGVDVYPRTFTRTDTISALRSISHAYAD